MNNKKTMIIFSIMAIAIFFLSLNGLSAADVDITNTSSGGIKDAITKVGTNQIIYLDNGIYSGFNNTNLTISKSLTIHGKGDNVIIDARGNSNIFNISRCSVNLVNIKFRNGGVNVNVNGGAIYNDKGTLTIMNSYFTGNRGNSNGGAIYNNEGILNVINSNFTGNNAVGSGGAIYSIKGSLNINNSNFYTNGALYCGGAVLTSNGTLNVNNSIFSSNSIRSNNYQYADGGGAIYADTTTSNIIASHFTDNFVFRGNGAAIHNNFGISLTVVNSSFTKNIAGSETYTSHGGAIYNNLKPIDNIGAGTLNVNNSNFTNNTATSHGAAICILGTGTASITASNFTNNTANSYGDAIYISGENLKVINCIFINNKKGTIDSGSETSVTITNCLFLTYTSITVQNVQGKINQKVLLTAILKDTNSNKGIEGKIIKFYVNNELVGIGTTNSQGIATYDYLPKNTGNLILNAFFDGDNNYTNSSNLSALSITNEANNTNTSKPNENTTNTTNNNSNINKLSTIIIMNEFKGTCNNILTLSATLKTGNYALASKIINFYVNNKFIGQGITNSQGIARFNYKISSTGNLNVKAIFNEDNKYKTSSKISNLAVPKMSELKIKNVASIKGKTAKITHTIANLGYNKGTFKLTFKLAKGLTYKKPKFSLGKISYNKKTRILTWSISNLEIHRTKAATLSWNLKAKKGSYSMTPKIVKNNNVRILSNNKLNLKIK